jgi:hypothetical protein
MPSSKGYKRDYKREAELQAKRGEVKDDMLRKRARRAALKRGLVKKGEDWAHKKALSKGGNATDLRNGKAESPGGNRSFARNKDGSMKSEVSKRER